MTPLNAIVDILSTRPEWSSFSGAPGIQWFDTAPVADEGDGEGSSGSLSRSGKLLLQGFDETDLPNGRAGTDFDYVRGNEGESGITLSGDAQSVDEIAVTKFYPDTDYVSVLARQFPGAVRLQAITASCPVAYGSTMQEANAEKNAFYRLTLPSGGVLYVEGSVIEDGGKYSPGNTVYRFYRTKPVKRMEAMHCKNA